MGAPLMPVGTPKTPSEATQSRLAHASSTPGRTCSRWRVSTALAVLLFAAASSASPASTCTVSVEASPAPEVSTYTSAL